MREAVGDPCPLRMLDILHDPGRSIEPLPVIDGAPRATGTVEVGARPAGVAVNPVTNKAYVANAASALCQ